MEENGLSFHEKFMVSAIIGVLIVIFCKILFF